MYTKWRDSLGLDALFHDVQEELKSSVDFLMADRQVKQTDSANKLALFAAFGVIIAFAATLLGMNFIFEPALWSFGIEPASTAHALSSEDLALHHKRIILSQVSVAFGVLAGSSLLFLGFVGTLHLMGLGQRREPSTLTFVVRLCVLLLGVSLAIGLYFWHWRGQI